MVPFFQGIFFLQCWVAWLSIKLKPQLVWLRCHFWLPIIWSANWRVWNGDFWLQPYYSLVTQSRVQVMKAGSWVMHAINSCRAISLHRIDLYAFELMHCFVQSRACETRTGGCSTKKCCEHVPVLVKYSNVYGPHGPWKWFASVFLILYRITLKQAISVGLVDILAFDHKWELFVEQFSLRMSHA